MLDLETFVEMQFHFSLFRGNIKPFIRDDCQQIRYVIFEKVEVLSNAKDKEQFEKCLTKLSFKDQHIIDQ